jgi:hypothetical protein
MADVYVDRDHAIAQLRESLAMVEWAARGVPEGFAHALMPQQPADAWAPARNVAHLVVYEEGIAAPVLESLAAGGDGAGAMRPELASWFEPDAAALEDEGIEPLLARLRAVRERQVAAVGAIDGARFNECYAPVFPLPVHGSPPHSPGFVAMKTVQHTWEHGNAILRAALFAPRR